MFIDLTIFKCTELSHIALPSTTTFGKYGKALCQTREDPIVLSTAARLCLTMISSLNISLNSQSKFLKIKKT